MTERLRVLERSVRADVSDDSAWGRLEREKARWFGHQAVYRQGGEIVRTVDSLLSAEIRAGR